MSTALAPTAPPPARPEERRQDPTDLSDRHLDIRGRSAGVGVPDPITATGMGWGPYPDPTAPPDPRYDQLNRRVTISVTCC